MNAVKRCLTVLAVALVAGACGGDQTAEEAGTSLTIRATPSAVWMRNNTTAEVILEAVDKLGGATAGSWQVDDTVGGIFTVALDTAFQSSSAGPIGIKRRFVITATAEGDGSVRFKGTGDTITIPVRIAPDTAAFNVTMSDTSPNLFQNLTITAPAGIAFTPATTVRFYSGTQSRDTANGGLSFPVVLSLSADSSQITFVPGPSAHGFLRLTAVASRSTPSLVSTARTAFQMVAVPAVDTNAFSVAPAFKSTGTRGTTSFFDTLVVVAPANYKFQSNTTVEFFRIGVSPTTANPTGYAVSNGTAAPVIVYRSTNLDTMKILVAPGLRGRLKVNPIAFDTTSSIKFMVRGPAAETFDLRSPTGPDTSNMAITFSKASPIAEGDTVTAIAPAGMVFLNGTAMINTGTAGTPSGGDSARIVLRSADSTKVTIVLPPGATGKFRYSAIARRDNPKIVWAGRSATTINAVAAPAVVASLTPGTVNMNDTVTVALDPAGPYRFRPTSVGLVGGFQGMVASVSLDSLTMKILPPPGFTGPMTLTNIRYANLPTFQVVAATAASVTINAAFSLGGDDPKAGPTIPLVSAPTAAGQIVGFWDQATLTADDYTGDGGVSAQYIRISAGANRSVNFKVDWTQGTAATTDIDFILVDDDGAFDSFVGGVTTGAASGKPENATYALLSGHTYVLAIIDFAGNILPTTGIKVTMVGQ